MSSTPEGSPTLYRPVSWYQEFRDKRKNKKDRAFPKVTQRKRDLSLPRKKDDGSIPLRGKTAGQMQSLFFKLPAELRTAIYETVVGEKIHIVLAEVEEGKPEIQSYKYLQWKDVPEEGWRYAPPDLTRPGIGVIGLLQSCRGVYVLKRQLG